MNCLTEIFVERALARAKELDEYLFKNGKVMGPLHGLPVSCKDMLRIKGQETVMGYASYVGVINEYDSVLVEIMYECGANPFVQTNVPQTLMVRSLSLLFVRYCYSRHGILQWPETHNLVYGRTLNPYNRKLTPGGSSGGEGALVAMRGSPLGLGSDIGGYVCFIVLKGFPFCIS